MAYSLYAFLNILLVKLDPWSVTKFSGVPNLATSLGPRKSACTRCIGLDGISNVCIGSQFRYALGFFRR
uniref:Secreted protein n=1 Tax=Heterorhabditis bacteriophora TaxID=37862 RepID=A0A1I7WEJ5_HETBA